MSNETELRIFQKLEGAGELAKSQVPATVRRCHLFTQLLQAGVMNEQRKGAGRVYVIEKPLEFERILDRKFPGRAGEVDADAVANVRRYRNTKAGKKQSAGVVLLRGSGQIELNGHPIDLGQATERHGCTACCRPAIRAGQVCLVENLDTFFRAEDLLGKDWTFVHPYGRVGVDSFAGLEATRVVHFGDYDYTGLKEYLQMRAHFSGVELYVPENLETLWASYSQPLKKEAVIGKRLRNCEDPTIHRILILLETTGRFLEQQALFIDLNLKP